MSDLWNCLVLSRLQMLKWTVAVLMIWMQGDLAVTGSHLCTSPWRGWCHGIPCTCCGRKDEHSTVQAILPLRWIFYCWKLQLEATNKVIDPAQWLYILRQALSKAMGAPSSAGFLLMCCRKKEMSITSYLYNCYRGLLVEFSLLKSSASSVNSIKDNRQ